MVGADLSDFVLEHVEGLDLEGPHVGGESGLSIKRCLCSIFNLGLHVSLHVNVLREVAGRR